MITLLPPSRRMLLRTVRRGAGARPRWAYLGTSMRKREALKRRLGSGLEQVAICHRLQDAAKSLREQYIDYIGRLGVEEDNIEWWLSSLSEKNPTMSRAFLHICYVVVAVDLCRSYKDAGSLVLVVERPEVRRAIADALGRHQVAFTLLSEPAISRGVAEVRGWMEMAARRVYWITRLVSRMVLARAMGFSAQVMHGEGESGPWILLHNWVDARCLPADGRYRDVFFGELRECLEKRGLSVAVVGAVPSHTPYGRLLARLKQTKVPVLIPEAALTPQALIAWARTLPIAPLRRRVRPPFEGIDVSEILAEVERVDWINPRAADARLTLEIVRQWSRYVDARVFIYPYEGHLWERGYCHAFRVYGPRVKLIGYQHATVPPMWLNHFIAQAEIGKVPFPDRIVTNSAYHYSLFLRNHMPEDLLASGGAYRYAAFEGDVPARNPVRPAGAPKRVLIAPSIIASYAAELLLAAIEAFPGRQQHMIVLRCHPRSPAARVAAEAGMSSLPPNVVISERSIIEVIREVDVLVYSDSTIALEGAVLGVPLVHYRSSHEIDLDPLDEFPDLRVSVSTPQELRDAVQTLTVSDPDIRSARANRARQVFRTILAEPDEDSLDQFLPNELQHERSALRI